MAEPEPNVAAMSVIVQELDPDLVDACGADPGFVCERVFDLTGDPTAAEISVWLLDRPLRILFILLLAWIVVRLGRRTVMRFATSLAATPTDPRLRALREMGPGKVLIEEREQARAQARAETIGLVLRSVVSAVVWTLAAMLALGEVGLDLGPLIAGAGIGGIALGFGAQSVVRDFLSGLFMLIEDQYGVGDIIDAGEATGTVEKVSLRTTTLRDVRGVVWHIPNGEILRVGNFSQLWSRALIDIEVAYDTDLRFAMGVVQRIADELWEDPEWGGDEVMERPEVWGVQDLGASGIAIRLVIKTEPSQQWAVERELRLRLKEGLDAAGIEIPFPQSTVWLRNQGDFPPEPAPDPATVGVHALPGAHDDAGSDADAT